VLFIAVSLLGAIALHELVEKPVRRALLRRWQPNRPTAPAT
jgi:peptidoglycan/LPS O-acetylase OafA/YrhL